MVIIGDDPSDPQIMGSHLICKECKHPLEHKDKISWLKDAKWISQFENKMSRGFYINQLYSMTMEPCMRLPVSPDTQATSKY